MTQRKYPLVQVIVRDMVMSEKEIEEIRKNPIKV